MVLPRGRRYRCLHPRQLVATLHNIALYGVADSLIAGKRTEMAPQGFAKSRVGDSNLMELVHNVATERKRECAVVLVQHPYAFLSKSAPQ